MKYLKSLNELEKLVDKHKFILLDFTAKWCGPCKSLIPKLEDIEDVYDDVKFIKVDVDDFPEISEEYKINSMPTLILLKDGIISGSVIGADINAVMKLLSDR